MAQARASPGVKKKGEENKKNVFILSRHQHSVMRQKNEK